MKITEALLAEHLVFHNLFDHVEKAAPGLKTLAEIKAVAALLESALRAHTRIEDNLFIGPMEHCFEQIGQRETFHHEHENIDGTLAEVGRCSQPARARKLLLSVIVSCRSHFDKEERIVFPMAERILKTKTLQSLALTWMNQRKA